MHFRDVFLFFIGVISIGLTLFKIFPEWVIYIGLGSFILMGIRLVIQGIKLKVAATPFRPSIEDLEYQRQKKAEKEAQEKFVEDELKRYKNSGNDSQSEMQ